MNDYSELKADAENGEFPKSVAKKILDLIAELEVTDKIIAERNRLLAAIPACPVHGQCVPNAIEWVEKAMLMMRALKDENEVARMRIKELDLLFGRYILAMRAAVIEENAEKGMEWIYNSLAGPGELPPEDETDAQAYFDREIVAVDNGMQEVLAFHDARRKGKESVQ